MQVPVGCHWVESERGMDPTVLGRGALTPHILTGPFQHWQLLLVSTVMLVMYVACFVLLLGSLLWVYGGSGHLGHGPGQLLHGLDCQCPTVLV